MNYLDTDYSDTIGAGMDVTNTLSDTSTNVLVCQQVSVTFVYRAALDMVNLFNHTPFCAMMYSKHQKGDSMKKALFILLAGMLIAGLMLGSCGSSSPTKITVVTDATYPPFESINDNKVIEGFDIDVMNAIAKEANLEVEFQNVAWDPLLAGMAQGTYDVAISCITITEERAKTMLFSDAYYTAGQIVVVAKNNTTFKSKDDLVGTVGSQLGTTGNMEVDALTNCTSKPYDDIGMAFQDLMNGQIIAVICDAPVATSYVSKNSEKLKTIGEMFTTESYGIAFAKAKTDLRDKINKALAEIKKQGLIDQYAAKWLTK
jgi:polar amino acid transport system substrate-binding protein